MYLHCLYLEFTFGNFYSDIKVIAIKLHLKKGISYNKMRHQCCCGTELTLNAIFISNLVCVWFNFLFILPDIIRISAYSPFVQHPLPFFSGKNQARFNFCQANIIYIIFGHIFSLKFQPVAQLRA